MRFLNHAVAAAFVVGLCVVPLCADGEKPQLQAPELVVWPEFYEASFRIEFSMKDFAPEEDILAPQELHEQLQNDPDNPGLALRLARSLAMHGAHEKTKGLYEQAVAGFAAQHQAQGLSLEDTLAWAEALEALGRPEEAIEIAEALLDEQGEGPLDVHRLLTRTYSTHSLMLLLGGEGYTGDISGMFAAIGQLAHEMTPEQVEKVLPEVRELFQRAMQHCEKTLVAEDVKAMDYFFRAALDWWVGIVDTAVQIAAGEEAGLEMVRAFFNSPFLQKAMELIPDNLEVQADHAVLRIGQKIDVAVLGEPFDTWPEEHQEVLREEARLLAEIIAAADDPPAKIHDILAIIYHLMNDRDNALVAARAALAVDPTRESSFNIAMAALIERELFEEALELAVQKAEIDRSESAYRLLTLTLIHAGEIEEAEQMLRMVIIEDRYVGNGASLMELIGATNLYLGNYDIVTLALEPMLGQPQARSLAAYHLAAAAVMLGNADDARQYLQVATESFTGAERYSQALGEKIAALEAYLAQ